MKKLLYILLPALAVVQGCYKDIEIYDPEDFNPRLTVFSFMRPGAEIVLQVSQTDLPGMLDSSDYVTDATAELWKNNVLLQTSRHLKYQLYKIPYEPAQGDSLRIVVRRNDQAVEANAYIPPKDTADRLEMLDFSVDGFYYPFDTLFYYDAILRVKVHLQQVSNPYYGFILFNKMTNWLTADTEYYFFFDTVSYKLHLEGGDLLENYFNSYLGFFHRFIRWPYGYETMMVVDSSMFRDGTLTFYTNIKAIQKAGVPADTVYLIIVTLSREMYEYYRSEKLYLDRQDYVYLEPVTIFSNVQGGLGVIAGYNYTGFYPFVLEIPQNQR